MNISGIHDCYGCGVCAVVCPHNIIQIELNKDGFYEPSISNITKCVNCGLCADTCAYLHENLSLKKDFTYSYGAWSKNPSIRKMCSSGGVGFEIGSYLISQGYKVCGVKYNPKKNIAEHYIANTIEELIPSIGSKYIQSYTVNGFKEINKKEKYLVIGTPCQIDSFRRYIRKFKKEDNFVLMDFFCHGVPSMLLWNKYIKWAEKKIGKIKSVSWRNKQNGWHDSWVMSLYSEKVSPQATNLKENNVYINSKRSQGDMFYNIFLSDICLGRACYKKCKYKYNKSCADIRLGDAWGKCYINDDNGVSTAIAFTSKGYDVIHKCNCVLEEQSFETIAEGQMIKMPQYNILCKIFFILIKFNNISISKLNKVINIHKSCKYYYSLLKNPIKLVNKIKNKI